MRFGFGGLVRGLGLCVLICAVSGCSLLKEKSPDDPDELAIARKPIPPERAKEVMSTVAEDWFYGEGVGDAALTAGTVVVFPPYIAVVLGNAALSLSGYEPITISGMLPKDAGQTWSDTYDAVASSPGKLTAAMAGREFRTAPIIKDDMHKLLEQNPSPQPAK